MWAPDVVIVFFGGVSKTFLGHFYGISNISSETSVQAQLIATLFEQIG